MDRFIRQLVLLVILASIIGGAAGLIVGFERTTRRAESKLELYAQQGESFMEKYQLIPSFLARHPFVAASIDEEVGSADLDKLLTRTVLATGAHRIAVATRDGTIIAQSYLRTPGPGKARKMLPAASLTATSPGSLNRHFVVEQESGKRLFELTYGISGSDKLPTGLVVVQVDLEGFEIWWRSQPELFFLMLEGGRVIASNATDLLLQTGQVEHDDIHGAGDLYRLSDFSGFAGAWLGAERRSFITGTRFFILSPLGVLLAYILTAALMMSVLAALVSITSRYLRARRQLIEQELNAEKKVKEQLERLVEERTLTLRAEMAERKATEERLRRLQEELMRGEKLRVLGEMSAGISHEINQPLFAIQSLVSSIHHCLEAGASTLEIQEYVDRVGQIADRIGGVVRGLRGFAHDEEVPVGAVNLIEAVNDVIRLLSGRFANDSVEILWAPPEETVTVIGENIGLQQVLVNLIINAADAAKSSADRRVIVSFEPQEAMAILHVRDFGAGIDRIDKIFDPFYSTKPTGAGMGLGLSISKRIMRSFGGQISAANCADGGAVFALHLQREVSER